MKLLAVIRASIRCIPLYCALFCLGYNAFSTIEPYGLGYTDDRIVRILSTLCTLLNFEKYIERSACNCLPRFMPVILFIEKYFFSYFRFTLRHLMEDNPPTSIIIVIPSIRK